MEKSLSPNVIGGIRQNLETSYPEPLEIKEDDKILILAPHADDESIGCGGLLLKYAKQCDVICVTNCKTGNPSVTQNQAIDERKKEFTIAMQSIKVNNYFYTAIDSDNLINSYSKFCTLLDKYTLDNYKYISIPIFYDQHEDHKALVKLLQRYIIERNSKNDKNILFYEVWSTISIPNKYIDLTDSIDSKMTLIGYHTSQLKIIDYRERIKALNIYRGMIVNKKAVEMYCQINIKEFKELEL